MPLTPGKVSLIFCCIINKDVSNLKLKAIIHHKQYLITSRSQFSCVFSVIFPQAIKSVSKKVQKYKEKKFNEQLNLCFFLDKIFLFMTEFSIIFSLRFPLTILSCLFNSIMKHTILKCLLINFSICRYF